MVWDLALDGLRVMIWIIGLGYVIPRYAFTQDQQHNQLTYVSQTALVAVSAALVLWLLGQLSLLTFVLGVAVTLVGRRLRKRAANGLSPLEVVYLKLLRRLYRSRPGPGDLAPHKSDATEPPPSPLNDVAELAKDVREKVNLPELSARGKHWIRPKLELAVSVAPAAAFGLAVGIGRLFRELPLSTLEVRRVLGSPEQALDGIWLLDVALMDLISQLSRAPSVVSPAIVASAVVFTVLLLGKSLSRRLAPHLPPLLAQTTIAWPVIYHLLVTGEGAVDLLTGPVVAWCALSLEHPGPKSRGALYLALLLALLAPLGAPLAVAAVFLTGLSMTARASRAEPSWLQLSAGSALIAGLMHWKSGFGWVDVVALFGERPAAMPSELGVIAAVCCLWLLFPKLRDRFAERAYPARAVALITLACTFGAGGFDGTARVAISNSTVLVLLGLSVAIATSDLCRIKRLRRIAAPVPPLVAALLAYLLVPVRPARADLPVAALELVHRLEQKHLAWGYTLVAAPRFRPAVEGRAYFLDEREAAINFPASSYYFHPGHPEFMVGTRYTYIAAPKHQDSLSRAWALELRNFGLELQDVPEIGGESYVVFLIERNPIAEKRLLKEHRLSKSTRLSR